MEKDSFDKCEYCNKQDTCLGECAWNGELLESSYANYYAKQMDLNDNYHREGIMIEMGMFGKY